MWPDSVRQTSVICTEHSASLSHHRPAGKWRWHPVSASFLSLKCCTLTSSFYRHKRAKCGTSNTKLQALSFRFSFCWFFLCCLVQGSRRAAGNCSLVRTKLILGLNSPEMASLMWCNSCWNTMLRRDIRQWRTNRVLVVERKGFAWKDNPK